MDRSGEWMICNLCCEKTIESIRVSFWVTGPMGISEIAEMLVSVPKCSNSLCFSIQVS